MLVTEEEARRRWCPLSGFGMWRVAPHDTEQPRLVRLGRKAIPMSSDTRAIPEGLVLETRNRHLALALSEIAECLRDMALAALAPPAEHNLARLGAVVTGLDRATARIRADLLQQKPPSAAPADAPAVTDAMRQAADDALLRQYRAQPWEEAKDVLEGIDFTPIIAAALAAQTPKEPSA